MNMDIKMTIYHLLAAIIFIKAADSIELSQCIAPLGMESGAIRDEDITASSSFDSGNVGPQFGRMRQERNGGAWCPKHHITKEPKEWIEIDLHTVHMITGTGTQGRFGNGQGAEFAEAYVLEYWRPRLGKWFRYRDHKGEEVITANTNTYLEAKYELDPPVWASKIRFLPYSYHQRTVCMRVEIYGCYWNDGVVSYSMPQGDKRGAGWKFFDATYDGYWDVELKRGLGQLTDGKVGPDNFKASYYDQGQGWVGWRNDTRGGQPVEIKFEFDTVREFTDVHIYCNNQFTREVQVFAEAKIWFSIGGRYYTGEPITYTYIEDRIFETSRNVSIKLHHRIGRFVKLQLNFAAKWVMISEVMFESDVAHGNFSAETAPPAELPIQSDEQRVASKTASGKVIIGEALPPISTAKQEDPTYMAVIIGVLTAVILLLAIIIVLIVYRNRQRKCFASPLATKNGIPSGNLNTNSMEKGCMLTQSGQHEVAYGVTDVLDDDFLASRCGGGVGSTTLASSSGRSTLPASGGLPPPGVKLDDYQEPYQALKYAPYYSYSTVVMEMKDMMHDQTKCLQSDTSYDYAVPEMGHVPLLSPEHQSHPVMRTHSGSGASDMSSRLSKGGKSEGKKSPSQQEVLNALKRRLEQTIVPEFPLHRLRMVSKLAEGAFGTVYVAEADGIPEYGTMASLGKRLVAVKFLLQNACEKEKEDFHRDVRILAALEDNNIARVLGMCTNEEPLYVVMEYLEHGDLCQFLKTHHVDGAGGTFASRATTLKTLSFNCLLYMAAQIASGMQYLETLNFVHRDLATRNCLVGKAYQIKISDFGTDNEIYAADYYKVDGNMPLPIRWMAWESVFLGRYSTKSDVWSFAVTLWEILTVARRQPFDGISDPLVVENLANMHNDNGQYKMLPKPTISGFTKDMYDLMAECWRRNEAERPTFREINLFLQRKNLGYAPA